MLELRGEMDCLKSEPLIFLVLMTWALENELSFLLKSILYQEWIACVHVWRLYYRIIPLWYEYTNAWSQGFFGLYKMP